MYTRPVTPDNAPFESLFNDVRTHNTMNADEYPTHLKFNSNDIRNWETKGRFDKINAKLDANFPNYHANLIRHREANHILLEGPAQHNARHCERFMEVLVNENVPVTDVFAVGDPFDGRKNTRGYLNYFGAEDHPVWSDHETKAKLSAKYEINSQQIMSVGGINTYAVSIKSDTHTRDINVHHIPSFRDFKTLSFSCEEVMRMLAIFQQAKTLAIHCSAGMGRTGVMAMAYVLLQDFNHFYPGNQPDFKKIKFKLEELRVLRPALIQDAGQYRMAIILGMQLHAASRNELTDASMQKMSAAIDEAAVAANLRNKAKYKLSVHVESDENIVSGSEHSGDEENEVSAESVDSDEEQARNFLRP